MDQENGEKYTVKVAERCFEILDLAISQEEPLTNQNVAAHLKINTNMAFRLLSTMVNSGYLTKDESSGQYHISLKVLHLTRKSLLSLDIRRISMPYLELLWHQFPKANLNMAVYYDGDILVLDRIDSVSLPRTYFTPGKVLPFHCTGLGKVLTSEMPEEDIDRLVLEKGLNSYTTYTISDPVSLKKELAKVREEQCARDRNEFILNDNCNAVPIRNQKGAVIAAISLSAFENYMSVEEVENTMPVLMETGRKISFLMGYQKGSIL
ncbi:IclR family transcriptional regulator [Breznakiella homolactica]|uniref:IclR family transcriptional regulator n=1 Tax=Breznakiella homolactica TaxID=2798577 RepID=A0A7T7XLM3_9SPIR|nr:IclR family transcriptional regulator [Breznakiella homolactica]QQO08513.1 IclR family transcriptional regulator [Breznakiella homolactica]